MLFTMTPGHPNVYAPGKRPFHTIIPAFVRKDGKPWLRFGVMGGAMQPQGHVQIVVNLNDFGMGLQEAGDAARWQHESSSEPTGEEVTDGGFVHVEWGVPWETVRALEARGHDVRTDVVRLLVEETCAEAVRENALAVVASPEVVEHGLTDEGILRYVAVVEIRPFFELGEYKGLAVTRKIDRVEESHVDAMTDRLRERLAVLSPEEERVNVACFDRISFNTDPDLHHGPGYPALD